MPRDRHRDRFNVLQHILIAEPNHIPSASFEFLLPRQIVCINKVVIAAINLYDQPFLYAREIGDEWSDGNLTAKLQATHATPA